MAHTDDNLDKSIFEQNPADEGAETEGEEEENEAPSDSADEGESEEDSNEGEEDESEEGSDSEEEMDPNDPMAKFKDKSPEQIIDMYRNLEGMIERKAIEKAQEILAKGGKAEDNKGEEKKEDADLLKEFEGTDFSKMTPKQFAQWMLGQVDKRALTKAQEFYEQSTKVRNAVSNEIREATKEHPHLKENAEYRDVVINLIEAAASRKETLTLKEACQKADKALKIAPKKEEKKPEAEVKKPEVKKNRTGVEKTQGTDSKAPDTDEDSIRKSILGGSKSTGVLGGLGI